MVCKAVHSTGKYAWLFFSHGLIMNEIAHRPVIFQNLWNCLTFYINACN